MDINVNEIMGLMNSGMTAEEIAKTFTDALNQAIPEFEKQQREKEKAKNMKADAKNVVRTTCDFIAKYANADISLTEEEMDEAAQTLIDSLEALNKIDIWTGHLSFPKAEMNKDPIADFLAKMGL